MIKWTFATGVMLLLSGCAALAPLALPLLPTGSATAQFHTATSVTLEQANFLVVKTNVVGESKGFSLLGIITIVPAQLSTAIDRLYGQAELQHGRAQSLANLVVERSGTYLILYSVPRVSIRADVVEFVPSSPARPIPGASGETHPALPAP